jgi:hypothetical protein
MRKRLLLMAAVLLTATMSWAGTMSWTGTVSDSHCGAKHAQASDAAAGCVSGCVQGGAKYVLVSDGKVYDVDAQDKFAAFAGKSVKVTGKLKGKSIAVASVEAAREACPAACSNARDVQSFRRPERGPVPKTAGPREGRVLL